MKPGTELHIYHGLVSEWMNSKYIEIYALNLKSMIFLSDGRDIKYHAEYNAKNGHHRTPLEKWYRDSKKESFSQLYDYNSTTSKKSN